MSTLVSFSTVVKVQYADKSREAKNDIFNNSNIALPFEFIYIFVGM